MGRKVLVISSSPGMSKSTTHYILKPFMDGMIRAGGKIDLYFTHRMKINPCYGDFKCWIRHPGRCYQDDDMQEIYEKFRDVDILVLSTPVYVDGMSGTMKMFIDRLIPTISPYIELREDHCRHLIPDRVRSKVLVLVSTCGYYEPDNFDPLVYHVKAICRNLGAGYGGALLRPHGAFLPGALKHGAHKAAHEVIRSAEKAGESIVTAGEIDSGLLHTISKPLLPREDFMKRFNAYFEKQIRNSSHQ